MTCCRHLAERTRAVAAAAEPPRPGAGGAIFLAVRDFDSEDGHDYSRTPSGGVAETCRKLQARGAATAVLPRWHPRCHLHRKK